MMIVGVALLALPATAQTFGTQQAEQPNAVFQSTSSMQGSGSTYSANPTLNSDGTASYGGQQQASAPSNGSNKPRRTAIEPSDDAYIPLGDALLPLLFMSLAFCGYLYLRRKRSAA